MPLNPCATGSPAAGGPGGGGGGGGGFGGGGANAGPWAAPGTYTVALVADGKVVDSKPLRIVMDPEVERHFSAAQRVTYDKTVNDLHSLHQRGATVAARLTALATQVAIVDSKIDSTATATTEMKARFDVFEKEFTDVRAKFGVPAGRVPGSPAPEAASSGPGGGGGGFGGGAVNPLNAYGRLASIKGALVGIWEAPSAGSMQQVAAATKALEDAMKEAESLLAKVASVNDALKAAGLSMTMP